MKSQLDRLMLTGQRCGLFEWTGSAQPASGVLDPAIPPSRPCRRLIDDPGKMVLGRSTQERQSGESHEGPTPFTPRYFEGNREHGGCCPTVKERVVSRKSRDAKALRFGEDRYSQRATSTWPD